MHARPDGGMIEEAVVVAPGDRREGVEIRDDRPAALVTIQAEKRARGRKAVGRDTHLNGRLRSA